MEKILRHVGFVRLNDKISPITAVTWLTPEIIMLIGSIVIYVVCNKLTTEDTEVTGNTTPVPPDPKPKKQLLRFSVAIGAYS